MGNDYINNYIHDAPQQGIFGSGPLNRFIGNTLDLLCYEVGDSGAWYSGYSWTRRGIVLHNNTFSRVKTLYPTWVGGPPVVNVSAAAMPTRCMHADTYDSAGVRHWLFSSGVLHASAGDLP